MPTWTHNKPEDFALLEPGEYPAKVTKAAVGMVQAGKSSGAEKIEISVRVDDRTTIRDALVFSQSAAWKIDQFIAAAKICTVGQTIEIGVNEVNGKLLRVRVGQEEITKKDGTKMIVNRIEKYIAATTNDAKNEEEEDFA